MVRLLFRFIINQLVFCYLFFYVKTWSYSFLIYHLYSAFLLFSFRYSSVLHMHIYHIPSSFSYLLRFRSSSFFPYSSLTSCHLYLFSFLFFYLFYNPHSFLTFPPHSSHSLLFYFTSFLSFSPLHLSRFFVCPSYLPQTQTSCPLPRAFGKTLTVRRTRMMN